MNETDYETRLLAHTADLLGRYISIGMKPEELAGTAAAIHAALKNVNTAVTIRGTPVKRPSPDEIRASITPDALISFEDGKPYKTLKRHLTKRGMTADGYRQKWGLPSDYPMTAPNYSAMRSQMAKDIGLGRK